MGDTTKLYGGFLKWWYPTTMGFPTKNDHFGVFWGYHHLRKHPYPNLWKRPKLSRTHLRLELPNEASLIVLEPGQKQRFASVGFEGNHVLGSLPISKKLLQLTLPKTDIAPARKPSQKETSLPTIHFRCYVSFREGMFTRSKSKTF